MTLEEQRKKIDQVNKGILDYLAERMSASADIAQLKAAKGLPIYDPDREAVVLDDFARGAEERGLSSEFARHIMSAILQESRRVQEELIGMNSNQGNTQP